MDVRAASPVTIRGQGSKLGDKVSEGAGHRPHRYCRGAAAVSAATAPAAPSGVAPPVPPGGAPVSGSADIECGCSFLAPDRATARRRSRPTSACNRPRQAADARGRLPQRRLHPVQGAPASPGDHGEPLADCETASVSARRASISTSCDAYKDGRSSANSPGPQPGMARGEGGGRAERWPVSSFIPSFEVALAAGGTKGHPVSEDDQHRRRLAADRCRSTRDDRASSDSTGAPRVAASSPAHAGRRRRHHRPRDGQRLFGARSLLSRWSNWRQS